MVEQLNLNPTVLMDSPEAYTQRADPNRSYLTQVDDFLDKSPHFTEGQKRLVELEAGLFSTDPTVDPTGFVATHANFVSETKKDLSESLPSVKEKVVERVAAHFAKGDRQAQEDLESKMRARLEATKEVGVYDNLEYAKESGGFFDGMSRQPNLTLGGLLEVLESSPDKQTYRERVEDGILAHEVMHGVLASATQPTSFHEQWSIRNGLTVTDIENPKDGLNISPRKHGEWVSEATLESLRREIMQSDDVRYEPAVIFLETLNELSPGLRDELFMAALDVRGPGPAFGKVEMLIGPTGIEEIERILSKVEKFEDMPKYKATVIGMLPRGLQAKAVEIFDRKELEIFGGRKPYQEQMAQLTTST